MEISDVERHGGDGTIAFGMPMSIDPRTASDYFEEGVAARAGGKPVSDNPYCVGTVQRTEWDSGWKATLELDEDDDPASDRIRRDAARD